MATTRRVRAFKRWMKANGVDCSDALDLVDDQNNGVSVRALSDLKVGDVVANISKTACLTIKTSGAREMIESTELDGTLGLSVAVMYERSLGEESPWAGYLQILPFQEDLPLVWPLHDLDSLLSGTEIHKEVKEDHVLIYEDWKEHIVPLTSSLPANADPDSFGINEYFAVKTLIASRSFRIDDYHGSGMVPLADLFNHKTGEEDVHFTAESSDSESDTGADETGIVDAANEATDEDEPSNKSSSSPEQSVEEVPGENTEDEAREEEEEEDEEEEEENSSMLQDDLSSLKMIMEKNVSAGSEVFNTYGLVGNAALLHRYGFTELGNPYSIVNIDLGLITEWSTSSFTSRHTRARFAMWRKLGYAGSESQSSEYFEVSSTGEPETELLMLLYILLLPDDTYNKLDLAISTTGDSLYKQGREITIGEHKFTVGQCGSSDVLLTDGVCEALLAIADKRESLYGSLTSLEDDVARLETCLLPRDRRLYHSLVLRVTERRILEKLRSYIRIRVNEISGGKRRKKMNSIS